MGGEIASRIPLGLLLALVVAVIDFVTSVQVVLGFAALTAFVAVGSSKRKDATIADLEKAVETEERLHRQSRVELAGASERADHERERRHDCDKRIAGLEKQVETLLQYAAPEAFKEIIVSLGDMRTTIRETISSQGELILKNTELQAQAVQTLERVARDLEVFAARLRDLSPPATPDS